MAKITDRQVAKDARCEILAGSEAFKKRLLEDLSAAESSAYIQAMTFEADTAGNLVLEALLQSKAADRRLLIDDYSRYVVNDTFVFYPPALFDAAFRAEVRATRDITARAVEAGVQVKYTNPIKGRLWRYPFRNHKKLVVIDRRILYIGGINFSDHNFAWHDVMLRVEHAEAGDVFADDFTFTWNGENQSKSVQTSAGEIYFMDGYRSAGLYTELFARISAAKSQIFVFSPYVSDPLLTILEERQNRNVPVEIIMPGTNNKGIFPLLIRSEAAKGYFSLREFPGEMSHLKAILIDDAELWLGSCNYDMISYFFEQEIIFRITDKSIIEAFKNQILTPDRNRAELFVPENASTSRLRPVLKFIFNTLSRSMRKSSSL